MRELVKIVLVLLLGLGLLTLVAWFYLTTTTRDWFERDVDMRSRLAVASASDSLVRHWDSPTEITKLLEAMTRDQRVMGAAACADGEMWAKTSIYPEVFSCTTVLETVGRVAPEIGSGSFVAEIPGGRVQLTVVPVDEPFVEGQVILAHDLSFVDRREATTRNQLLVAFVVLSIGASALTLMAARLAWRGWTTRLRQALAGESTREFQPLVRDVRELVDRLSIERETDPRSGPWTAARLRAALAHHLQGEKVIILANREPYIHERGSDGTIRVLHPASGLVTALEPVMRACSGVWVAHGSGSADRETVDKHDRIGVPPNKKEYVLRRVWLTTTEEEGYYYGFSNEGLWPLCHVAHVRPEFREQDWAQYKAVNQKFADAVCAEVDTDDPIVLVQDYHFALVPRMIRNRLPRATILTFWHIPWPSPERIAMCPWRNELLDGMLGSSILGFHMQQHCNNFLDAIDTFVESRIDREDNAVIQGSGRTLVRPYPISIEWPVQWLPELPPAAECRAGVFADLGLPADGLLGVGVDRLDYTKGIEERLSAVDHLLESYPEFRGRFVFAQIAAPSRARLGPYQALTDRVEALAESINRKWQHGGYRPIVLVRAHHEPPAVFRYFRAADLCYVSSLHDGMNLVAKEFVAARDDERGVLVLSRFAGAAKELSEALVVNPYDLRQASDALAAALTMPAEEQGDRMRAMRGVVAELNVYRWAGRMLADAAGLRRRERLAGRLARRASTVNEA
jgi:trehalose 6-phosphate synthase